MFFLNLSKKLTFLKTIYLYYNLYIRNFKFFFNSSQFGEDKRIIKLFTKSGIYLDIGCFHPVRHSNTYLMYKSGWSGINIDLNPLSIKLFNIARPLDINICAALSDKKKVKNLYFHHELSPLNTITREHTLLYRDIFGLKNLKIKKIKTKTLKELLRKYNIKKIDFLNIDVEGQELEVLKTLNFNHFNIKVICIEILTITKKIKKRRNEIVKFLKKKNYTLKFKSARYATNYIFIKK